MTAPRTVTLLLLAATLAAGCGSSTTTTATETSPAASISASQTTDATAPAPSGAAAASTSAAPAPTLTIRVAGGAVSGDTGRQRVKLGSTVRLQVTADVADEVHVHGYDLHADTTPGKAATVEFTASTPGVFEVELENSKTVLLRLQVQ